MLYGYNREEASVSRLAAYYELPSKVNCKKQHKVKANYGHAEAQILFLITILKILQTD